MNIFGFVQCKYIFDFSCNFFVLFAWVWLSTRASRLLHECRGGSRRGGNSPT